MKLKRLNDLIKSVKYGGKEYYCMFDRNKLKEEIIKHYQYWKNEKIDPNISPGALMFIKYFFSLKEEDLK